MDKIETSGTSPHPKTLGHTSTIEGNKMIIYGGCYEDEDDDILHKTPY